MGNKTVKRIILFASGSGTNVENIISYFRDNAAVDVSLVLSNNPKAGVLKRVKALKTPFLVFSKADLLGQSLLQRIKSINPDLIVLAGFLLKIPIEFVNAFPQKIINIHPSLLPKYGGKGMYGDKVHQSVKEAGETETGITIHLVNEYYDQGALIFQTSVALSPEDSVSDIAQKVHQLEYAHFPEVINKLLFP
ncbi:MAG: phosphoribosylglycinamide formyltransferase [Flavobacteriales bacterium MED-G15]|nr:MAG: phosphoribosylglycinamide formyltransferase [Flavobacteriales bacterium MED-G15]|tara:strand:- start:756 stop:1334 length:579 start_codon:yes stop_codon:yes gene_type:complete